ncbi:MAG: T9SS type A sorting domain-containing protein [bacterium]|nr:T9SS type A sorting domain-containing protein [bacterium]
MFQLLRIVLTAVLLAVFFLSPSFAQDSSGVECITRNYHNWVSSIQGIKWMPNRVYLAVGYSGLRIVNISSLSQPSELGSISTLGFVKAIDVVDTLAFVIEEGGCLHIIDIANPASPTLISTLDLPGTPMAVDAVGQIAYVSAGSAGVVIIDASDPSTPIIRSHFDTPGSAWSALVVDSTLYVADSTSVRVLNTVNPDTLVEIAWLDQPARRLAVETSHLFVPNMSGLAIYSINPIDSTALVGTLPAPASGGWWNVAASDGRVYLTNNAGLTIVNVANPASPSILYLYTAAQNSTELTVANHIAFLSCNGLRITDVTTPTSPQTYTTFNLGGYDSHIAMGNGNVFVANRSGGMLIFSSDLQTIIGRSNAPTDARQIVVNGNYAYVQSSNSGIHVMNCTNPSAPSTAMVYTEGNRTILDMTLSGTKLYFAIDNGVRIIDVSAPGSPTYGGAYRVTTPGTAVAVDGMTVYLGLQSGAVHIVNVTNAMSPTLLGTYQAAPSPILDLQCTGTDLYVLNNANSLRVLSVENPAQPQLEAQFDSLSDASGISVLDDYVLVSEKGNGIRVLLRVSDTELRTVGFYNTPGSAYRVLVDDQRVYVADSTNISLYDYEPSTDVDEKTSLLLPDRTLLLHTSPNPFNATAAIDVSLPVTGHVSVNVTNIQGRTVATLFQGFSANGVKRLYWKGCDAAGCNVASGVYFVTVNSGSISASQKIVLMR